MSSKLDQITDWSKAAAKSAYQLKRMAQQQRVSGRQLRRYLQQHFGVKAKIWVDGERVRVALEHLRSGHLVKETSSDAQFKHRENFSAFYKRTTGSSPSEHKV